jgi:hypothetical protein
LDHPFESPERLTGDEGGLQARLLLYKETMTPQSGLSVVCANDDEEVEAYCQGTDLTDPRQVKAFERILYRKSTPIEEENRQMRCNLKEKVIAIVHKIRD